MNKEILPQGNNIRQLLVKSNISDASINSLLKEKGVFVGRAEKNDTVPLLMKSLISPEDFENLYEIQKSKEEAVKYRTASIECSDDFGFSEVFVKPININEIIKSRHTYQPKYKVIGNPNFYFEGSDTAIFDYRIERENLLNDWTDSKTYHNGSLILKKTKSGKINITVQQNSTAKETIEVNKIIISHVRECLHEKSLIDDVDSFTSIRFNDFTNANRIKFLYSFAKDFGIYVEFKSFTDLNLYLDPKVDSPEDIKRFLKEIDNLRLRGKGLQNHVFISSEIYHEKLLFSAVTYKYDVDYNGTKGTMYLNMSFPAYIRRKTESSELQTQLDFTFRGARKTSIMEDQLRKKLLPIIENLRIEKYDEYKIK